MRQGRKIRKYKQWLRLPPSNAGGAALIPGQGAKIPHASRPKNQNIKQKQYCNKFNKDFKNGPHQKKKGGGERGEITNVSPSWMQIRASLSSGSFWPCLELLHVLL